MCDFLNMVHISFQGLLPSEWVIWGESFPERLAGDEGGGFFYRGKSGQAFLRLQT